MKELIKNYRGVGLFGMVFGGLLYAMLMAQQLTNTYDGLWNGNVYHAGAQELSLGRWLLEYVDNFTRGIHAEPIGALLTLALFTLGVILLLELFRVENKKVGGLALALFLSAPLISNTLSYRFTALGYSVSFALAILALFAAVRVRHPALAILLGGLALAASMGAYQTYLGAFCTAAVFYVFYLCYRGTKTQETAYRPLFGGIFRIAGTALAGGGLYLAILSLLLRTNGVAMSGHNGANAITPMGLLSGLPDTLAQTYHYFSFYFFGDRLKISALADTGIFYLLFAALFGLVLYLCVRSARRQKWQIPVLIVFAAALPIACSAYMLVAGNKLELQMTGGLALVLPLTALMAFELLGHRALRAAAAVVCGLFLYGNILQVWTDQQAMYEGRNACVTMATQIVDDLKEEELLSPEYQYYFVGVPARNEMFSVSAAFPAANGYAQFGNFWVSGMCNQMSYHGLVSKYMGLKLPMAYLGYDDLAASYPVDEMAAFPKEGYIDRLDERTVLIKISPQETYADYETYYRS